MAKSKAKIKKNITEQNIPNSNDNTPEKSSRLTNKDKVRIGLGLIFFILGTFLTLAIIGYIYAWKEDQDLLISAQSFWGFIFNATEPIANFCGRLGAIAAHYLVYNGIGISALLVTFWLTGIGYNLLVKKKVFPATRWLNVIALGFLVLSPILSYIFQKSGFSFGGAFGNSLIEWTYGFAGNIGIILMGLLMLAFFYFVVFQFRAQPVLKTLGSVIPAKDKGEEHETDMTEVADGESFKGFSKPPVSEEEQAETIQIAREEGYDYTQTTNDDMTGSLLDDVDTTEEELNFTLHIKSDEADKTVAAEQDVQLNVEERILEVPVTTPLEAKAEVNATMPPKKTGDPEVIFSAVAENGIVLEIPEVVEEEASTTPNDTLEINLPKEEEAQEEDLTLDINESIEEAVSEVKAREHHGIDTEYQPELDLRDYKFPSLSLLAEIDQNAISVDREELENNKNQIVNTLRSFGIEIQRISATVGPTVTLYEIVPAEGVRISKIKNLEDDIALNLAALGIRIIAPIPGRGTIGIEVPNTNKQIVSMRSILASEKFQNSTMSLPIALGKKIDNENYIVDLATMPHLLMAGATGQGKSVGINTILVSLLYKKHPSELKFVLVDPKKVELSVYRLIEKHYLAMLPDEEEAIITDTKKVVNTLNALCIEMDNRYELLKDAGARNIKEYNKKFKSRRLNPEDGHKFLPFIVLVIDEFADLIMTAGKEVEMPIARLAQLARAIGIHIIIATQRPSVNVITGIIKANFPARIAFRVSAKVDSRTILDAGGADQLIGRGDMLISIGSDLLRLQCAFVDTPEVERIVEFIGEQRGYPSAFLLPEYEGADDDDGKKADVDLSKRDKMFEDAARLVVSSQSGSTSMLQRKFNLGYNRAGRIMDQLEAADIVGPAKGSKPREVLIKTEYELEQLLDTMI